MIERAFAENLHPRGTGALGGQFVAAGSSGAAGQAAEKRARKKIQPGRKPGDMAFDGKRGTGYGTPGGDKRVKALQTALNKLGLTDSAGKALKVDGKLGPRTTAAIKKAQRKLGLKADGVVTPALLAKLTKAKKLEKAKPAPAKKAAKKAAPAKKATTPAAPRPKRSGKGGDYRAPEKTVQVGRSIGYSERMTDLERHGTHNQRTHGNRLGRPTNVPGKTGLAKLAEANRVGTNDVRLDDEVTIIRDPERAGSPPAHLGKRGTVIDADDGSRVIVEFDDGGRAEVFKGHIRVDRTRHDPELEKERRAKLDAEVKAIRDRADARKKATSMDEATSHRLEGDMQAAGYGPDALAKAAALLNDLDIDQLKAMSDHLGRGNITPGMTPDEARTNLARAILGRHPRRNTEPISMPPRKANPRIGGTARAPWRPR
jgi:peptidoglycan hydrolase-like protein with peptidoglycan-binding domain